MTHILNLEKLELHLQHERRVHYTQRSPSFSWKYKRKLYDKTLNVETFSQHNPQKREWKCRQVKHFLLIILKSLMNVVAMRCIMFGMVHSNLTFFERHINNTHKSQHRVLKIISFFFSFLLYSYSYCNTFKFYINSTKRNWPHSYTRYINCSENSWKMK